MQWGNIRLTGGGQQCGTAGIQDPLRDTSGDPGNPGKPGVFQGGLGVKPVCTDNACNKKITHSKKLLLDTGAWLEAALSQGNIVKMFSNTERGINRKYGTAGMLLFYVPPDLGEV